MVSRKKARLWWVRRMLASIRRSYIDDANTRECLRQTEQGTTRRAGASRSTIARFDVQLPCRRKRLRFVRCASAKRSQTCRYHARQLRRDLPAFRRPSGIAAILRHSRADVVDDLKHHRLLFSDAEPTDRVAVKSNVYGLFEAVASQVEMAGALNDSEECLCPAKLFGFDVTSVATFVLEVIELRASALPSVQSGSCCAPLLRDSLRRAHIRRTPSRCRSRARLALPLRLRVIKSQ